MTSFTPRVRVRIEVVGAGLSVIFLSLAEARVMKTARGRLNEGVRVRESLYGTYYTGRKLRRMDVGGVRRNEYGDRYAWNIRECYFDAARI